MSLDTFGIETTPAASGGGGGGSYTASRATAAYPAAVSIWEVLDCSGAGGNVSLAASAGLSDLDESTISNAGVGGLTVVTPDGATINGAASFTMPITWENYRFVWLAASAEWRVMG